MERSESAAFCILFASNGTGWYLLWYFLFSAQRKCRCRAWHCGDDVLFESGSQYCDGADIVSNGNLDGTMVAIDIVMGIAGIAVAYLHYTRKDIC